MDTHVAGISLTTGNYGFILDISYCKNTKEHRVNIRVDDDEDIEKSKHEKRFVANGGAEAIREGMRLAGEMVCDLIKNALVEPFAGMSATRGIHDDEEYGEILEFEAVCTRGDIMHLLPDLEELAKIVPSDWKSENGKTLYGIINMLAMTASDD